MRSSIENEMITNVVNPKLIKRFGDLLANANNIVLTCHLSPDGDAVGSSLGLCGVLRNMGKNARVVMPDMVPRSLMFMPGVQNVLVVTQNEERSFAAFDNADLVICLDFNNMSRIDRLGEFISKLSLPKVLIDHHLDPQPDFDVMISHPEMSSTCELVYRVVMQMGLLDKLDTTAASCLCVGMITDTGNFTYNAASPELYEIIADLLRRGVDKERLYKLAYNTFSADSLRLQGYAICEKMQLFPHANAALIALTRQELEHFNYKRGDTESLVNKPLAIPGVNWVVLMREDPEYVKVSMRSIGDFDVNVICREHYSGGGHRNAAGGQFYGTIDDAVNSFYELLQELEN